jgi:hypothetical protein
MSAPNASNHRSRRASSPVKRPASPADTAYYIHPWEFASRPQTDGRWLRNRIFLRRVGPWMERTLGRILRTFAGRITTVGSVAARYTTLVAAATATS